MTGEQQQTTVVIRDLRGVELARKPATIDEDGRAVFDLSGIPIGKTVTLSIEGMAGHWSDEPFVVSGGPVASIEMLEIRGGRLP